MEGDDRSPSTRGCGSARRRQRRRAISDAATALFMERGFEAVTIAEVAEAAGVSIKTIFNYFGSKEELFLDREAEARAATLAAVADRPPGASITEGFLALLDRAPGAERRRRLGGAWTTRRRYEQFRRFLETWTRLPRPARTPHARRGGARRGARRERSAPRRGLPAGDDRVRTMTTMLVSAMHVRHETLARAILDGLPPQEVAAAGRGDRPARRSAASRRRSRTWTCRAARRTPRGIRRGRDGRARRRSRRRSCGGRGPRSGRPRPRRAPARPRGGPGRWRSPPSRSPRPCRSR